MKLKEVGFELAKKLKEIGFDIPVRARYAEIEGRDVEFKEYRKKEPESFNSYKFQTEHDKSIEAVFTNAPTQALAQMWFRKKHNIEIEISLGGEIESTDSKYFFSIGMLHNIANKKGKTPLWYFIGEDLLYDTYEKALEAGLLKACEIVKNKH